MEINAPDLTKRPPRSPRVRLGGYVILPRLLDKCRAHLGGLNGDYHYNCPIDQQFLRFAGIDADELKAQAAAGKGDTEILDWINAHAKNQPAPSQVIVWSDYQEHRAPADLESRKLFQELHSQAGAERTDIQTWFDLLDLDDFISFGGKA